MKILSTVNADADIIIDGSLEAITKSFYINHPEKEGMMLKYGSLEGPENGVYIRGTSGNGLITLPTYWAHLVADHTMTVTITPLRRFQKLYVESMDSDKVIVRNASFFNKDMYFSYVIYGERKDTAKLEIESPKRSK